SRQRNGLVGLAVQRCYDRRLTLRRFTHRGRSPVDALHELAERGTRGVSHAVRFRECVAEETLQSELFAAGCTASNVRLDLVSLGLGYPPVREPWQGSPGFFVPCGIVGRNH